MHQLARFSAEGPVELVAAAERPGQMKLVNHLRLMGTSRLGPDSSTAAAASSQWRAAAPNVSASSVSACATRRAWSLSARSGWRRAQPARAVDVCGLSRPDRAAGTAAGKRPSPTPARAGPAATAPVSRSGRRPSDAADSAPSAAHPPRRSNSAKADADKQCAALSSISPSTTSCARSSRQKNRRHQCLRSFGSVIRDRLPWCRHSHGAMTSVFGTKLSIPSSRDSSEMHRSISLALWIMSHLRREGERSTTVTERRVSPWPHDSRSRRSELAQLLPAVAPIGMAAPIRPAAAGRGGGCHAGPCTWTRSSEVGGSSPSTLAGPPRRPWPCWASGWSPSRTTTWPTS